MSRSQTTEVPSSASDKKEGSVEINGIRKVYNGDVVALNDVNLVINPGEFFTLLGPSGSGKSTLLHLIGGFISPTSGTIVIDGIDMTDQRPQSRPTNTVFQAYALFPHMTVDENVRYGLQANDVPRSEQDALVDRYLGMLQINHLRDREPAQLSGGQQQRVALARTLVLEPEIILLDEPLGALDEKLRRQMQFELKRIHDQLDITFVYVTHDQEEALTMSDRVGILHEGDLLEIGQPTEIYSTPRKGFTAKFLGEGNVLDGSVVSQEDNYLLVKGKQDWRFKGHTLVENLSEDETVGVCVRPEHIRFVDTTERSPNRVSGSIQSSIYVGREWKHVVELESGDELQVVSDNSKEIGSTVELAWDPEDCIIVEHVIE